MNDFIYLFRTYRHLGILKALWTLIRIAILPYAKINSIVPQEGTVLDIGCGNGGFTNYLAYKSKKRSVIGIDLSRERIKDAKKTSPHNLNTKFLFGDITKFNIERAGCYIMIDVLHHIPFDKQEEILKFLALGLNNKSILIIKEVDPSDKLPFLFGHTVEKILYPRETIYTRTKIEWIALFNKLNLRCKVFPGAFYFPDSTKVYLLHRG